MNRKNRSDECALPKSASHPTENQEKQHNSDGMKDDVAEMVAARFQSVNLAIDHVSQRSKRMPQAGVAMSQQPVEPFGRKTGDDVGVYVHVTVVVATDETVAGRLVEDDGL